MVERKLTTRMIIGSILVLLGVYYLIAQFLNLEAYRFTWPLVVMVFGGLFFVGMFSRGPGSANLAFPGSIIVTIGLISLFESIFSNFQGWSFTWTLIVAAVGAGFIIRGYYVGSEADRRQGWRLVRVGFILFLVFGAFFELVLGFGRANPVERIFWPLALIGVGVYLFASRMLGRANY